MQFCTLDERTLEITELVLPPNVCIVWADISQTGTRMALSDEQDDSTRQELFLHINGEDMEDLKHLGLETVADHVYRMSPSCSYMDRSPSPAFYVISSKTFVDHATIVLNASQVQSPGFATKLANALVSLLRKLKVEQVLFFGSIHYGSQSGQGKSHKFWTLNYSTDPAFLKSLSHVQKMQPDFIIQDEFLSSAIHFLNCTSIPCMLFCLDGRKPSLSENGSQIDLVLSLEKMHNSVMENLGGPSRRSSPPLLNRIRINPSKQESMYSSFMYA